MNGYERIIHLMREQGAAKNPASLKLGEMTGDTSVKVNDLELDGDDLIIAEHLLDHEITIDTETEKNKKITVHGRLKAGDMVLVYRVNDEQYAIIEKVTEVV